MALPSSGTLKLSDLIAEFGGGTKLTDFYRGGARVPDTPTNAGIPTSGTIRLRQFLGASAAIPFTPTRKSYAAGSGTETAPAGCSNVLIVIWGGGGAGGGSGRWDTEGAPGGASGAYCRSSYAISGGQTLNYTVGSGGGYSGNTPQAGGASTVSSGTKSISTMTANGGGAATVSKPSATGGTITNQQGNGGSTSMSLNGGLGGAGIEADIGAGVTEANGWGGDGADGNDPTPGPLFNPGSTGSAGKVVFYYT